MLLKTLLFITSYLTSISAKSVNVAENENPESIFDIEFTEGVENTEGVDDIEIIESIESKEFCVYTSSGMIKMIDPYYTDSSNNIIYFDNIEDYARYIGPNWFGVSYCGNNTLVNNVGEYYKIVENDKHGKRDTEERHDNERENEEEINNIGKQDSEDEISIFKSRTIEEYKEKIKAVYEDFIKNGLKSIPLASQHNPAYNPYHHALIKIDGIGPDEINFVTTMGIPYTGSEKLFEELAKKNKKDFIDCVSLSDKDSTMTCTISYTEDIQDTISISNENGQSYHRSNGKTITKGDTYTEEQNRSIELARAYAVSNSTNGSTSKGFSNSFETTHSIINSTSNSTSINREDTHTTSSEYAHTYTVNEDHSHSVTNGRDVSNETNWSKTDETSTTEEYARMDQKDFEKFKGVSYYNVEQIDTNSDLANAFDYIQGTEIYKYIAEKANIAKNEGLDNALISMVNEAIEDTTFGDMVHTAYGGDQAYSGMGTYHKRGVINLDMNHQKRDALGVVDLIIGGANLVASGAGVYLQDQANVVQKKMLQEQMKESADELNNQIAMGLAGTRTSGSSTSHASTKGGSNTVTDTWSECITDSSGISDGWTNSTGYSDAHTTGYGETSTKENSVSDTTSKMLTSNFNEETGWVNEASRTNTTTNGYSYGHSNQYSNSTQDSLEEAVEISAQNSYQFSNSISKGEVKGKTIQVTLKEDGPQTIVPIPIFLSEVTIWATGYKDENGETKIRYNKSLVPVEVSDFSYTLKFYGDDTRVYSILMLINLHFIEKMAKLLILYHQVKIRVII